MSNLTTDELNRRLAALSPAKRALLELRLKGESRLGGPEAEPIPRRADRETAPLSFAQQRLWFLDQLVPGTGLYNLSSRIRLKGELRPDALTRAIEELVIRHEALRTSFPLREGEPYQLVSPAQPVPVPLLDLTIIAEAEREAEVRRLVAEEARRPFDLARGPVFRPRLIRLAPDEHVLQMSFHHIVTDAWSMGILFRELGALYQGFASESPKELPPLSLQYADYAVWQREWLQGENLKAQLSYWRDQFRTDPAPLSLPTSGWRPTERRHAGAAVKFTVDPAVAARLEALGQQEGVTLFMTMLAAYKAMLARYCGSEDVVVGTPIAGRTRLELETIVGFFVNALALRSDLSGNPTFRELVRRVRAVCLGAYAHQEIPFERLVEELQPERNLDRNPLFQAVFALKNAPRSTLQLPGLTLGMVEIDRQQTKFDLTLAMKQKSGELRGTLAYATALFDQPVIQRMAEHFQALLRGIAANPDIRLSELPLLGESDRQELVLRRNATARVYPPVCLHELFEEQVRRTPDAIAASGPRRELTYRELNHRANRLASRLRELGVGPESRVGLCLFPSLELLVGILGTLKAGGAYVPLEPTYPQDRLALMLTDAGVEVVLVGADGLERELLEPLPAIVREVFSLDVEEPVDDAGDEIASGVAVAPDNLAYVMYTSGSTGVPKGVSSHHAAVANFVRGAGDEYRLSAEDRVLHLASISSDISTDEIFPAWASGAAVVLPAGRPSPGSEFIDVLRRQRVSVVSLPTAYWHAWVQEIHSSRERLPSSLRLVIVGGEQVQDPIYAKWRELGYGDIRFLNTYGPTEATVQATVHQPDTETGPEAMPIGRPVANARVYVVDRHLNLLPDRAAGELCVGGAGVARGYLGRPAITALRFVPDPFSAEPGARLYRTGDRVRYRANGELEFLGRIDHQVKIRGYRIEPGEIEAVLARHPKVRECVVSTFEASPGEHRLVAYVVPAEAGAPEDSELVDFLMDRLPAHMVPLDFVRLAAIPLTPNRKVDRKALPAPAGVRPDLEQVFIAPRTPLEESIAEIWAAVLKVDRVGVNDNFFTLGGHSLLATQVVSRVRVTCGTDLPLRALFESPTVAGLAQRVQAAHNGVAGGAPPLVRLPRDERRGAPPPSGSAEAAS